MMLSCEAIKKRHSSRLFDSGKIISAGEIKKLLYAASLAPSGKNIQPWRFRVISKEEIKDITVLLPSNKWFSHVGQAICIFLDTSSGYEAEKDAMAVGACIENMLIEAECNGISTCWIGECTNYREQISSYLGTSIQYKLMAIIAIGYGKLNNGLSKYSIEKLII